MTSKLCVAFGCPRLIGKDKYFCALHWAMVPHRIKYLLGEHFVSGQLKVEVPTTRGWEMWLTEARAVVRLAESKA